MIEIQVNKDDDFDKIVKRFSKMCRDEGFIKEINDRRYYKKPSQIRREERRRRIRLFERIKKENEKEF